MTMIQITLIFQISSGPLWYNFVHDERSVCKQNWVPLVLFLQNYIFVDHMVTIHHPLFEKFKKNFILDPPLLI